MAKLRTATAAHTDIRDIRVFSKARFGAHATAAYLTGLSAMFDRIAMQPLIGFAERDLGAGMRSLGYRSHRIYYRLAGDEILVVRILHQSRDAPGIFESTEQ